MDENLFYTNMSRPYTDSREWNLSDNQYEAQHRGYYPSEHDRERSRNFTAADKRSNGRYHNDPPFLRTFSPMNNRWNADYGNSMNGQGLSGRTWASSERADTLNEEARASHSNSSFGLGYDASYGASSSNGSSYLPPSHLNQHEGHYGKGPKGWHRSDEQIREEVCEDLYRASNIDATNIEVSVKDGCVTLSGTVQNRLTKRASEECAERISGVEDIQNDIKVKKDDGLIGEGLTYTKGTPIKS